MDRMHYTKHGVEPVEWDGEGLRPGVPAHRYAQRCAVAAGAIAEEVAPDVGRSDMPQFIHPSDRRVLAQELAGGAGPQVSKMALALEMHEPEAYWRRAHSDLRPVVEKVVAREMQTGDKNGVAQKAMRADDFFGQRMDAGDAPLSERGDPRAFHIMAGLITTPGILTVDGGVVDEHERRALAAHALVHARVYNRDARTLSAMRESLPPEAQPVVADALATESPSAVMGVARRMQRLDREEFVEQARAAQSGVLHMVAADVQAYMQSSAAHTAPVQGFGRTVRAVEQAGALGAQAVGAMDAHGEANRALMGHFPMAREAQYYMLGMEIARTRVQEREMSTAALWSGAAGKARAGREDLR